MGFTIETFAREDENAVKMSESHFDKYEHYNYDQDKAMYSGGSGKQRSKLEVAQHTNQHNPAGHERKIATKLMNAEKNKKEAGKPHVVVVPDYPKNTLIQQ